MVADLELRTSRDLVRIARELRHVDDKELTRRFRRELRAAAKPLVPAVRQAIRRIPSTRPYQAGGLRGRLSKAVKLEVKTSGRQAGVVIRVDGRKMPSHEKALQSYLEGTKPRWRHPVFGRRTAWVQQPPKPYFYRTVTAAAGPRARAAVGRVLDQISRDIT